MRRTVGAAMVIATLVGACGGTASRDTHSREQLVDGICAGVVERQCEPVTTSQCEDLLEDTIAEADKKGCAARIESMLECMLDRWTSCDPPKDACPAESDALDACEYPPQEECLIGHGGDQSCSMLCLDWEMQCQLDGTSTLVCTCNKGPHMDESISIDSCQSFSTDFAREHCG